MLKKQVIQDDIVQDIIACTGRVMKPQEEITTGTPEIYAFYNYLYRTLGYYSMQSTDTLTLFATDIKKLLEYSCIPESRDVSDSVIGQHFGDSCEYERIHGSGSRKASALVLQMLRDTIMRIFDHRREDVR